MDENTSWKFVETHRLELADLLDGLEPGDWQAASLCRGWRVVDVAAHLALAPRLPGPLAMTGHLLRAGGRFHVVNHRLAVQHARVGPRRLVAELREVAASRRLPPLADHRAMLLDTLVHGQDVAVPLGLRLPVAMEAARASADRIWTMGWPFWARRRLRGIRLSATDTEWAVGEGREVRAPIAALLLVMTGRDDPSLPPLP